MAYNQRFRIALVEGLQQMTKGTLLGFRACVLRGAAVDCKTTDVADADRVGIVTATMGSGDVFWTGGLDGVFDGDDVVVAAACPTEGSVVTSGN